MKALVNTPICPIMVEPRPDCELADEALFGMTVEVLEETTPAYWRVRTHYRYEGYAPADCLLTGEDRVAAWAALPKKVVLHKNSADVMFGPKVQSWPLVTVPMGGLVSPTGEDFPEDKGWERVILPDGRSGWVRGSWLDTCYDTPIHLPEEELRQRLVDTAKLYRRSQYRWGGKTPQGIDCSGLVSMAYLLNGIIIYRDAHIKPGFQMVEITREELKKGDAIFFKGHVALYMGDGLYIHSTGKSGSDGVDVNSLEPGHPLYREDLANSIEFLGSYEGFH